MTRAPYYPVRVFGTAFILALAVLAGTKAFAQNEPTCMLSVRPTTATFGIPALLSWETANATSLTITGIGAVSPVERGTVTTTPTTSGTYLATVTGPGGTARCSIGITVETGGVALTPQQYAQYRNALPLPSAPTATSSATTVATTTELVSSLLGTILPLPAPGTTPAPLVLSIDYAGRVLIRGVVETTGTSTILVRSWGGLWTVRSGTFGPTTVIPQGAGGASDMSRLRVGDTVGIQGTVSGTTPFTVDAYLIRDWSTNPVTTPSYKG